MNTFDVAMEDGVIVLSTSCKSKEVFGGFGAKLAEELYFNISVSCMQGECHTFLTLYSNQKSTNSIDLNSPKLFQNKGEDLLMSQN